jgi:hypothetical protein
MRPEIAFHPPRKKLSYICFERITGSPKSASGCSLFTSRERVNYNSLRAHFIKVMIVTKKKLKGGGNISRRPFRITFIRK